MINWAKNLRLNGQRSKSLKTKTLKSFLRISLCNVDWYISPAKTRYTFAMSVCLSVCLSHTSLTQVSNWNFVESSSFMERLPPTLVNVGVILRSRDQKVNPGRKWKNHSLIELYFLSVRLS